MLVNINFRCILWRASPDSAIPNLLSVEVFSRFFCGSPGFMQTLLTLNWINFEWNINSSSRSLGQFCSHYRFTSSAPFQTVLNVQNVKWLCMTVWVNAASALHRYLYWLLATPTTLQWNFFRFAKCIFILFQSIFLWYCRLRHSWRCLSKLNLPLGWNL